jgi:hypothetical protein
MQAIFLLYLVLVVLLKTTMGLRIVERKYFESTPTSNCSVLINTIRHSENACVESGSTYNPYVYTCSGVETRELPEGSPNRNCSGPVSQKTDTNSCFFDRYAPTEHPFTGHQISCVEASNVIVPSRCEVQDQTFLFALEVMKVGVCEKKYFYGYRYYFVELAYEPAISNKQIAVLKYYNDNLCQVRSFTGPPEYFELGVCQGSVMFTYYGGSIAIARVSSIVIFGYFIFTFSFLF